MFQGIVGLEWKHSRDPLNHVSCLQCWSVHGKIRIEYNGEILAKLQEAPSLNVVVWSKGRLPFRMVTGGSFEVW